MAQLKHPPRHFSTAQINLCPMIFLHVLIV